jgi:pimeloyl-ACP methyl ester carboxylesterase
MRTPVDHRPPTTIRFDTSPGGTARARITAPVLLGVADHAQAGRWWRELRLDTGAHGLAARRPGPTTLAVEHAGSVWTVPVERPLGVRLAWRPSAHQVAGLARAGDQVQVWIADYRARWLRTLPGSAATSLTEWGPTAGAPLAWLDDRTLAVLVPPSGHRTADDRPRIHDATGPGFVQFRPDLDDLIDAAGAAVAVLRVDGGEPQVRSEPLLVRRLDADGAPVVEHVTGIREGTGPRTELIWATARLDRIAAPARRARPAVPARATPTLTRPPRPAPCWTRELPGHPYPARLTRFAAPGAGPADPVLLWIRARREPVPADRPTVAPLPEHAGPLAALDLPLHWPADASELMLHEQIAGGVRAAIDALDARRVVAGGHSFGATLALYAAAHLPDVAAAIAHSGCYNRTHTPFGFQYERRHYWAAPEIYTAFSALAFADRLHVPVLLVHGLEDVNPSTHPDQAVELYRAVVGTGGRARLVLLPHEEHNFRYRETHTALAGIHHDWLEMAR